MQGTWTTTTPIYTVAHAGNRYANRSSQSLNCEICYLIPIKLAIVLPHGVQRLSASTCEAVLIYRCSTKPTNRGFCAPSQCPAVVTELLCTEAFLTLAITRPDGTSCVVPSAITLSVPLRRGLKDPGQDGVILDREDYCGERII
jgi:hypothetical protein